MRLAFICDTPYQTFNVVRYILTQEEFENPSIDIYIGNQFNKALDLIKRIQKEKICDHTVCFRPVGTKKGYELSKLDKIKQVMNPGGFIHRNTRPALNVGKRSYDILFIGNYSYFAEMMRISYPNAKIYFYEDGTGTYDNSLSFDIPRSRRILYKLTGKTSAERIPERMYVNNASLYSDRRVKEVKQILSLEQMNREDTECLYRIFEFRDDGLYKRKIVYLLQVDDHNDPNAEKIQDNIMRLLQQYQDDTVIRMHPRMNPDEIHHGNIVLDSAKTIWELICQSGITEEHILIGQCSTAQMTPKIFFNKEPYLIFTNNIYRKGKVSDELEKFYGNLDRLIPKITDLYTNKGKIFLASSEEDVVRLIQKIRDGRKEQ